MSRDGCTFYSQVGKMAVLFVASIFTDKIENSRIYVFGYTFYSQNTLLAVLIEASGCKKCSHISRSGITMYKDFYRPFYEVLLLNMSLEIYKGIIFCLTLSKE